MRTLYEPAPGLLARSFSLDFFAAGPNVGRVAVSGNDFAHLGVVVAGVQAQMLVVLRGPVGGAGSSRRRRQTAQRAIGQFYVVSVCSVQHHADRDAPRLGQQAARDAALAAVRGVGPGFFSPSGALCSEPSRDIQAKCSPIRSSYSRSASSQSRANTPACTHCWNRLWAVEPLHKPFVSKAFHWQPVRSTKKMAFSAARSGTRGRWQPGGGGFGLCMGSSGSSRAHNVSEIVNSWVVAIPYVNACSDSLLML